jgi:hypothetical protein
MDFRNLESYIKQDGLSFSSYLESKLRGAVAGWLKVTSMPDEACDIQRNDNASYAIGSEPLSSSEHFIAAIGRLAAATKRKIVLFVDEADALLRVDVAIKSQFLDTMSMIKHDLLRPMPVRASNISMIGLFLWVNDLLHLFFHTFLGRFPRWPLFSHRYGRRENGWLAI